MGNIRFIILFYVFLLFAGTTFSQEKHKELTVDFRVGKSVIEEKYGNNGFQLIELYTFLNELRQDSTIKIVSVAFCGSASPEGSYQLNKRLSQQRLKSLEKLIRTRVEIPDSIVTYIDDYIPWDHLIEDVQKSDMPYKDEVLAILNEKEEFVDYNEYQHIDKRVVKLYKLHGGAVWNQIMKMSFQDMRHAYAIFVTYKKEPEPVRVVTPKDTITTSAAVVFQPDTVVQPIDTVVPEVWVKHLHVKTNVVGWAMLISNVAVEVDLSRHWSLNLPFYFSAMNYFSSTFKYRLFTFQPEVRYWYNKHNEGWYTGLHFGAGIYNYALGGKWRIQDHGRGRPSYGGGLSFGYRKKLTERIRMEFSLGAGYYDSHFDKFHNEKNGLLVESVKKKFIGIDNAAISFSYSFNLKKKYLNK